MAFVKIGSLYKYYSQSLCLMVAILNVGSEPNEKKPSIPAFSSNGLEDTNMLIFLNRYHRCLTEIIGKVGIIVVTNIHLKVINPVD